MSREDKDLEDMQESLNNSLESFGDLMNRLSKPKEDDECSKCESTEQCQNKTIKRMIENLREDKSLNSDMRQLVDDLKNSFPLPEWMISTFGSIKMSKLKTEKRDKEFEEFIEKLGEEEV